MLPVKANVPELLVKMGYGKSGSAHSQAVGDLSLIAFYYLLHIGGYTVKGKRNESKQTIQFKMENVTFFKKNKRGTLVCLPRDAPASLINTADSAMLKLDNQKNGWKGVCVHREANGEEFNCPGTLSPSFTSKWSSKHNTAFSSLSKQHTLGCNRRRYK
jgi:hypothetical protein